MKANRMKAGQLRKPFLAVLLALMLLLTAACAPAEQGTDITIFYTTDMHGRLVASEDAIGLDSVAALYQSTPNSLLLDAGDFLHGAPLATLSQGEDVVALMKAAGYSAASLGNHEFSFGRAVLDARLAQAAAEPNPFPLLSANIITSEGDFLTEPYLIKELAGLKIGIFGLTTGDTARQAAPDAVEGLIFLDPLQAAKQAVGSLREEGCDLIIALVHLGSDESAVLKSEDIAAQVEGISAVIDGHSHRLLDQEVNGIPLVAAGEYGQHLGRLVLHVEDRQVTSYSNSMLDKAALAELNITPPPATAELIAQIEASQAAVLEQVVGHTPIELLGEKAIVRIQETNLGNLTADALLFAAEADIALMNAGNIRATIPAGDITQAQILSVFPYSNIVVVKEVSGAQLRDILEYAVSALPEQDGRFAQVGGLSFELDVNAQPRVGAVTLADGTPLDIEASYRLVTNDFIAAGGDGYPHLAELPILYQGMTVEEAFLRYLQEADMDQYAKDEAQRIVPVATQVLDQAA